MLLQGLMLKKKKAVIKDQKVSFSKTKLLLIVAPEWMLHIPEGILQWDNTLQMSTFEK